MAPIENVVEEVHGSLARVAEEVDVREHHLRSARGRESDDF